MNSKLLREDYYDDNYTLNQQEEKGNKNNIRIPDARKRSLLVSQIKSTLP